MHPSASSGIQPVVAMRKAALKERVEEFRARCAERGLPCTHQRETLFRALLRAGDHPSPETLYERVRKEVPSISLGTVYRNLKVFVDMGLVGEVSLHHGSLRVETNTEPHHHLLCLGCRELFDLPASQVEGIRLRTPLPEGFRVERVAVEAHGWCAKCSRKRETRKQSNFEIKERQEK